MTWNRIFFRLALGGVMAAAALGVARAQAPAHRSENVVVVMIDGLRWQEVFRGAEPALLETTGPAMLQAPKERAAAARQLFGQPTAEARRQALMPFLWSVVAKNGQLFGNRDLGSLSEVTNGLNFSYPGYNETLTGFPDNERIRSNDGIPNPNHTVFEWLNARPGFGGRVAAFGAWDAFNGIFNRERCGFTVNAGFDPLTAIPATPELAMLNRLRTEDPRVWPDEVFDPILFHTAVEYVKAKKPRVLFIGLGETDDWAHFGSYAEYLRAVHQSDAWLAELWAQLQSMPEYKDKTTLIVLPDHGRGEGPLWTSHGGKILESKQTWMGFLGPDTAARGERGAGTGTVSENRVAATAAALLGEDYHAAEPRSGAPIADVLPAAQ